MQFNLEKSISCSRKGIYIHEPYNLRNVYIYILYCVAIIKESILLFYLIFNFKNNVFIIFMFYPFNQQIISIRHQTNKPENQLTPTKQIYYYNMQFFMVSKFNI